MKKRIIIMIPIVKYVLAVVMFSMLLVFDHSVNAQGNAPKYYNETWQDAAQDVKLDNLKENVDKIRQHIEFNDSRIVDLQNDLHTWKGIIVGLGSVIAILDLLQALGFARGQLKRKLPVGEDA